MLGLGQVRNTSFVFWCLFGTIYSIYASAWVRMFLGPFLFNLTSNQDFWMDWSVLRPHVKYPFLREELLYKDYIPVSIINSPNNRPILINYPLGLLFCYSERSSHLHRTSKRLADMAYRYPMF